MNLAALFLVGIIILSGCSQNDLTKESEKGGGDLPPPPPDHLKQSPDESLNPPLPPEFYGQEGRDSFLPPPPP